MGRFILERLLTLILKLFGMAVILFVVTQVLPADPAAVAAGTNARPEQIERLRAELGLDKPFHEQFITYISGLARGDLGKSLLTRRAVSDDLRLRFPATAELAIFSGVVIVILGISMGILAAVNAGKRLDILIRMLVVVGMGIPPFVLALFLQLIFAKSLDWFPLEGRLPTLIAPPSHVTGLYTPSTACSPVNGMSSGRACSIWYCRSRRYPWGVSQLALASPAAACSRRFLNLMCARRAPRA